MGKRTTKPGFRVLEQRYGISGYPGPGGINRTDDPGILGRQFYDLRNVRISGDQIISRGGLTRVTNPALNGAIYAIFDDQNGGEDEDLDVKLYIGHGTGTEMYHPNYTPTLQTIGSITLGRAVAAYTSGQAVYSEVSGSDTIFRSIVGTDGGGVASPTLLFTAAGITGFQGKGYLHTDGNLYLAQASGGTGNIYKWTGAALSVDDSVVGGTGAGDVIKFAAIGDDLYFMWRVGTDIVVRVKSGGSWSDFSTASVGGDYYTALTAYSNNIYALMEEVEDGVWRLMRITAGGFIPTAGSGFLGVGQQSDMIVFDSNLYMLWDAAGRTLAKYDGAAITENYFDLSSISGYLGQGRPRFAVLGSTLYIVDQGISVNTGEMIKSNGADTTAWTFVSTTTEPALEDYLLVV